MLTRDQRNSNIMTACQTLLQDGTGLTFTSRLISDSAVDSEEEFLYYRYASRCTGFVVSAGEIGVCILFLHAKEADACADIIAISSVDFGEYTNKGLGTQLVRLLADAITTYDISRKVVLEDRSRDVEDTGEPDYPYGKGPTVWSFVYKKFPELDWILL